jgi:hypothetical protein
MSFRMVSWTPPEEVRAGGIEARRVIPSAMHTVQTSAVNRGWTFSGAPQRVWPSHNGGQTNAATVVVDEYDEDELAPLNGRRRNRALLRMTFRHWMNMVLFGTCMLLIFGIVVFIGLGVVVLRVNEGVTAITNDMQPGITRMRDSSLELLNSTTALMHSSNQVAKTAHETGMVNSSAEVANLVAKLLKKPQITINLGS